MAKEKGPESAVVHSGLEGVAVAETRLSSVDGEEGELIIGGYDVEDLVDGAGYEQVCGLLWSGALPEPAATAKLQAAMGQARVRAFRQLDDMGNALTLSDGMDALRAGLAHLSDPGDTAPEQIAGSLAVLGSAWIRTQAGLAPVEPDPGLGNAADYLRMIRGGAAGAALERALETYLVTVSDHGMNASTFTARVVASTGSDRVSSVVAALGALKGPLHRGAPGPVLDMLDAIADPGRAEAWLQGELDAGRRIMGMGHRIYRVRDPRAAVLERAVERLEEGGLKHRRLELARAVEQAAEGALRKRHPDRPLRANVEFYTAVLLDAIGLDRRLFTPTFALGRVIGWCGHIEEQRKEARLIRPESIYVGPLPASRGAHKPLSPPPGP